ncbi:MAG: hypothetical protein LC126_04750 [Bryobacterales bacterium]|nr:hypothetical protein [Bryobacterales bacterium]
MPEGQPHRIPQYQIAPALSRNRHEPRHPHSLRAARARSLAQSPPPANYDESKVGSRTLPDPLVLANGKRVRSVKTWHGERRPEILRLFEENRHGHPPPRPAGMSFDVFDKGTAVRDGKAIRKQITIHFTADKSGPRMDLLLYVPAHSSKPVPVLPHLSFTANSLSVDDPGVKEGLIWNREKKLVPASQGRGFGTLRVDDFIARGFGIATVYYGDIEPDFAGVSRAACAVCF